MNKTAYKKTQLLPPPQKNTHKTHQQPTKTHNQNKIKNMERSDKDSTVSCSWSKATRHVCALGVLLLSGWKDCSSSGNYCTKIGLEMKEVSCIPFRTTYSGCRQGSYRFRSLGAIQVSLHNSVSLRATWDGQGGWLFERFTVWCLCFQFWHN